MAETGKAAVFFDTGKPFEMREYPVPDPEPDAIVVRVTGAGICGSDLHVWRGDIRIAMMGPGPRILGHEMTGRVHKLGANVTTDSQGQPLKEGDRIVYPYFFPCRRCYQCLRGEFAACQVKYPPPPISDNAPHFTGAYAEYFYMKTAAFVFKVPDELPDEMLTPVNCALSQVIFSLRKAGLGMGDTVVIQGAGGRGADIVLEVVGLPAVIPEGIQMVRSGGTYLEVGNISLGQTVAIDPSQLVWGNKNIIAANMYDPWILPVVLDFLRRNKDRFPLASVVSHKFSLEKIDEAFQQAEWEGKQTATARAVVTP